METIKNTKKKIEKSSQGIAEQKQAERTIKDGENENKYKILLENLPQKIFYKNKDLIYVSCNENYARDLKIGPDEIFGKTDYKFYPRELAEKYRLDDKRIMGSGKTEDIEEKYIQNGKEVFVHTVKVPVKDKKGNTVGILGIFWDITEHKKMEEQLEESRERYKKIFENVNDEIILIDNKGKILDVNEKSNTLFGYPPKEVIGHNFLKLGFLDIKWLPKVARAFKDTIMGGKPIPLFELEVTAKNGKKIPVEASATLVKKNGKLENILVIIRDITERKKAEEEFKVHAEKLERMNKLMVGRELKMAELKKEIERLKFQPNA